VHPFPCIKKWPKAIKIFEGVMYSFGKMYTALVGMCDISLSKTSYHIHNIIYMSDRVVPFTCSLCQLYPYAEHN
jgi:hypothetical protein